MTLKTGTSLASSGMPGASGSPSADSDRVPSTRLFGTDSLYAHSHNIHADMTGVIIHAFGLSGSDRLTLQMVVGPNEGDLAEDVVVGGSRIELSQDNTIAVIPIPGRYRLKYTGDNLGGFHAFYYNASISAVAAAAPVLSKTLA